MQIQNVLKKRKLPLQNYYEETLPEPGTIDVQNVVERIGVGLGAFSYSPFKKALP